MAIEYDLLFERYGVPMNLFLKNSDVKGWVGATIINKMWNNDILVLENTFGEICYISKLKFKELHKAKKIKIFY